MSFTSWFTGAAAKKHRSHKGRTRPRLRIEHLEWREVLSAGVPAAPHILDVGSSFPYATIQSAVDNAKPNDTIRIHAGTYRESVVVSTPHLTLEGALGENVVIENPNAGSPSTPPTAGVAIAPGTIGIWVTADPTTPPAETTPPTKILDGFRLSNVTVTGFASDGVVLTGVKNFSISKVTATDNTDYGIFPIFSSSGVVVASTASGSNDTGIYVGQSHNVVVLGNDAHDNVNGIEIENSRNVSALANNAHGNSVGILEDFQPGLVIEQASNNFIVANTVSDNNRPNTASPDDIAAAEPSGVGIAVVGGDHTVVAGNRVTGNDLFGIAVLTLTDVVNPLPAPYPSGVDPNPNFTLVIGNVVTGNGTDLGWSGVGTHNRWIGNVFNTSNVPLPS